MRAFGCLGFAYTTSRTKDKFNPWGIPSVFIGYPASQKGYKLLDLVTNTFFVSRVVKFHEELFPFNNLGKATLLQPVPKGIPLLSTIYDWELVPFDQTLSTPDSPVPGSPPISPHPISESPVPVSHLIIVSPPPLIPVVAPPRRSSRTPKPAAWFSDYHVTSQTNIHTNAINSPSPTNCKLSPHSY